VRRLRLRSTSADCARRATASLSDALHTASIPEAESARFIVIKHLDLGRIPTHASRPALALLIAQRARRAVDRARRFDQPGAAQADAVIFPSRADALVVLARRLARGESTGEWFWPQMVPGWNPAATDATRWSALVAALPAGEGFVVTAGAVLHEAAAAGALPGLLARMPAREAAGSLHLAGWAHRDRSHETAPALTGMSPGAGRALREAGDTLGGDDVRVIWAGVLLALHEQPARATLTDLPARVAAWFRAGSNANRGTPGTRPEAGAVNPFEPDGAKPNPRSVHDWRPPANPIACPVSVPPNGAAAGPHTLHLSDTATHPVNLDDDAAFSPCAGLLFMVTVLARLRFGSFVVRNPRLVDAAFPARLLIVMGQNAGMTDEDPIALGLSTTAGDASPAAAEDRWGLLFRAWLTAARRWSERNAGTEWQTLIRRPGFVRFSRTRIDVRFAPELADPAIRRVALDVDPGWVPWIGRVVRFHYLEER
jgi:hypothetical protein